MSPSGGISSGTSGSISSIISVSADGFSTVSSGDGDDSVTTSSIFLFSTSGGGAISSCASSDSPEKSNSLRSGTHKNRRTVTASFLSFSRTVYRMGHRSTNSRTAPMPLRPIISILIVDTFSAKKTAYPVCA